MNALNIKKNLWLPSALLILFALITPAYLALLSPSLGINFKITENTDSLEITNIYNPSLYSSTLKVGDSISGIKTLNDKTFITINAQTFIEEPDLLNDYDVFNAFFIQQTLINNILKSDQIVLNTSKGDIIVTTVNRTLQDLPFSFWFQVLCGIFTALTALTMYAFSKKTDATKSLWLTGISFYVVTLAAAPYSSRELVMDGSLFHILDQANHLGSLLFTAAFAALFWNYPRQLKQPKTLSILKIFTLLYLFVWLTDTFQLLGSIDYSLRWPILVGLITSIVLAIIQRIKVRKNPVEKAAMRWLFFSIIVTGSFFVFAITASNLIGVDLEITQAYAFGILTLMYLGLALGVSRYKLFQLESWWIKIWLWVIAGILIVVLDSLFVYVLHFNQSIALTVALVLSGLIYFPLRQTIVVKLFRKNEHIDEQLLSKVVSIGSAWSNKEKFEQQLFNAIELLFSPLQIEFDKNNTQQSVTLTNDGTTMFLPSINTLPTIKISMPFKGKKLFSSEDKKLSTQLYNLLNQVVESQMAFTQGQTQERNRIYSDLHDDLGAKLLSLTYRAKDNETADLARSALQDLRDVVSRSSKESVTLNDLLADWHAEAENRLDNANIDLDWQQTDAIETKITSSLWALNLGRIIREAISNILKHSNSTEVTISISSEDHNCIIQIEDFGSLTKGVPFSGRGTNNMRSRAETLNGTINWEIKDSGGCIVTLTITI